MSLIPLAQGSDVPTKVRLTACGSSFAQMSYCHHWWLSGSWTQACWAQSHHLTQWATAAV